MRAGYEDRYLNRHDEIWPEMLDAPRQAGIRKFNIFRQGPALFGFFETDDPEATKATLRASPVERRWSAWMAPIMKIEVDWQTQFPFHTQAVLYVNGSDPAKIQCSGLKSRMPRRAALAVAFR